MVAVQVLAHRVHEGVRQLERGGTLATGGPIGGVGVGLEPSAKVGGSMGLPPGSPAGSSAASRIAASGAAARPSFAEQIAATGRPVDLSEATTFAATRSIELREPTVVAALGKDSAGAQAAVTPSPVAVGASPGAAELAARIRATENVRILAPAAIAAAKLDPRLAVEDKVASLLGGASKNGPARKPGAAGHAGPKQGAVDPHGAPVGTVAGGAVPVGTVAPVQIPAAVPVAAAGRSVSGNADGSAYSGVKAVGARGRDAKGAASAVATDAGDARVSSVAAGLGTQDHAAEGAAGAGSSAANGAIGGAVGGVAVAGLGAFRGMVEVAAAVPAAPGTGTAGGNGPWSGSAAARELHGAAEVADGSYAAGGGAGSRDGALGEDGGGEARMLVANPNVLEVGIAGGAHGWLRVRAELEHTGEVRASLMASSAASAEALHRELGAMSAYLKSEAVSVASLAVTGAEKGAAAQGFQSGGSSAGAGPQGNASGSAGERSGERYGRGSGDRDASRAAWDGFREMVSGSAGGYGGHAMPVALMGAGVGGWLNVRV